MNKELKEWLEVIDDSDVDDKTKAKVRKMLNEDLNKTGGEKNGRS